MFFIEAIIVALRGIVANKLRTLLTMLGIMVGVGSVIVLLAYSEGTKGAAEALRKLGRQPDGSCALFVGAGSAAAA